MSTSVSIPRASSCISSRWASIQWPTNPLLPVTTTRTADDASLPRAMAPVRIVHLGRRTFPGHFSVERAFAQIRAALPDMDITEVVTSHFNQGLLPRLGTVLEARHQQGDVTHILGDINYAAVLTRRRSTILTVLDTEFLDRAGRLKRAIYTWVWLKVPVRRAGTVTVLSAATAADLAAAT